MFLYISATALAMCLVVKWSSSVWGRMYVCVCVCVFFKRNVNVLMQVSIFNFRYGDFVRLSVLRYRGGGQEEFSCSTVSTFERS